MQGCVACEAKAKTHHKFKDKDEFIEGMRGVMLKQKFGKDDDDDRESPGRGGGEGAMGEAPSRIKDTVPVLLETANFKFSSALFVPYIIGILRPPGFQRCTIHVPQRTLTR